VSASHEVMAIVHFLTACSIAKISPADLASTWRDAQEPRELMTRLATLPVHEAARALIERARRIS